VSLHGLIILTNTATALRSPGSPSFPMPEAEATQQELAGISIATLLKPLGS
jgi:hypothetical protein